MSNFYIETYGCRMNICDSEVIISILCEQGYRHTFDIKSADIIILNACSVREDGHNKIYQRLNAIREERLSSAILIIAGCFASLLKDDFFETYPYVDLIVNPNSYRDLPSFITNIHKTGKQIHIVNDSPEMYADIAPTRTLEDKTTAAITIMKGCNQYCSYCIEPFTRGGEHCMDINHILNEVERIERSGYKELTLVGHIIDKYKWINPPNGEVTTFAKLLELVAIRGKNLRIKYLSSHPTYFSDDIIDVVARNPNIMRVVHLPLQSGSNEVLRRMNRGYSVEAFYNRVKAIRTKIPDMAIISDIIVGFCGETESDFDQTVDCVKELKFDNINIFKFSLRSKTLAAQKYIDDVSESLKTERAAIINKLNREIREQRFKQLIGSKIEIIVEGKWNNDSERWYGRDSKHQTVVFRHIPTVRINDVVSTTIIGINEQGLTGTISK